MENQDWKAMIRFLEVLPESGDKELTLLKAHLVIEEVLTKILAKECVNEKYLNEAKLQFHQKVKLVRAFYQLTHSDWIWKALHNLNQARNHMSHNLTKHELENKISAFTNYVALHNTNLFKEDNAGKFSDFHMATFATYIPLAAYVSFEPTVPNIKTLLTAQ
ncbi:hypothetical protein [Agarivorans sp. Alg241-V36]|uniref:hypothetical protein n=1 Tax=Agarivorans sp. Alg241-V36 TaxID=2305992 RepID=UPI0013D03139|nr:hypothetical protein [Agarivorans sp. Alg241-V36]